MSTAFREYIKALAREQGCRMADFIALAPQNDPFAIGSPGDVEKAQWFADIWQQFGYTSGIHLRRVHYQIVGQDPPILKPNGEVYANTMNDWGYLLAASKAARYLGLVDPAAFVDRRNPDPIIHAQYWNSPTPGYVVQERWGGFDVRMPSFPELPSLSAVGYDQANLQPYHLEVWVEKTTMNDVLEPLCSRYGVNLITGAGELSITAVLALIERVKRADRPCRLFYISDFDPAGYGMPISVARKIEFFLREYDLALDIRLEPIALTKEQVIRYRLPRTPIKPTELRRGAFEDVHGEGAVELDAIEAMYPGELAAIVEKAILAYHDPDIERKARRQRMALERALAEARDEALADLAPEIEEMKATLDAAVADFEDAIAGLRERLPTLYEDIKERLERVRVDLSRFPLPEAKEAEEDPNVLYASERDYAEQLRFYKLQRMGARRGINEAQVGA